MKRLLLVRHGESEWNRLGRIQGQTDTPLTDLGFAQAERIGAFLAPRLSAARFRIWVSPMLRARQTADVIATATTYPPGEIRVDERINDFNVGAIAGTPGWERVARDHPRLAWLRLNDPLNFHPPGGESGADFRRRLADFLDQPDDGDLVHLVVSHGVVNKFLRSIRRDLHGADIIALGESQDSVFELDGTRETEHRLDNETVA